MEIAVLVKAVPDLEQLRYDPDRKTVVREGSRLFPNPFDQRAVLVGLALRRPGERLSVLSMGPPAAEPLLREALALGADRAVLLTDRALAGSDTLATSRALAAALSRLGHDLVITGKWTTDSETGQVPAELAGLLDVPVFTEAERVERRPDGSELTVVGETPDGTVTGRLVPPAVLSVGEKILKLRRPSPEEVARAANQTVEQWSVSTLGLDPMQVGLAGSPTVVATLRDDRPSRRPAVFAEGPLADRVAAAVAALRPRLEARGPVASPLLPTAATADSDEVLVLVSGADGGTDERTMGLLSELRRVGNGIWPAAVWVGPSPSEAERAQVRRAGALAAYQVVEPPGTGDSRRTAFAFATVLRRRPSAAGAIFLSDRFGREVAGQVASRLGLGLTGDVVGVDRDEERRLLWSKPAFGGGILAGIYSRTAPSLATVRPGVFEAGVDTEPSALRVEAVPADLSPRSVHLLAAERRDDRSLGDLGRARWVVSVGLGVGGPQALPGLRVALERWGAALGATRRVVDAGWLPVQRQVGLTGRSVAPELAVLLGSSGAANHLVGFRRARLILGINSNAAAPLFRAVDVGIVGDWAEVLPALTEALAPYAPSRSGRPPPPR